MGSSVACSNDSFSTSSEDSTAIANDNISDPDFVVDTETDEPKSEDTFLSYKFKIPAVKKYVMRNTRSRTRAAKAAKETKEN